VGLDPNTGRPRIALEVLEGMRQYLRVANAEERSIRVDRVIQSVKEAEKDLFTQKRFSSWKPCPLCIMICLRKRDWFLVMIKRFPPVMVIVSTSTRLLVLVNRQSHKMLEIG